MKKSKALAGGKRFRHRELWALMVLALPSLAANADTYSWVGGISNNVQDASNWQWTSSESEPNGAERVILNTNGTTYQRPEFIMNDANNYFPVGGIGGGGGSLYIGNGAGQQGSLDIYRDPASIYSHHFYTSTLSVGTDGGSGELNIHNISTGSYSDSSTITAEDFHVGMGSGSVGVVNVLGTGKTVQSQTYDGAPVAINGQMIVGQDGGEGTINIDGSGVGSMYNNAPFLLGSGAGSKGTINILNGGKLSMGVSGGYQNVPLIIGDDGGQGFLNVSGTSAAGDQSRTALGAGFTVGQGAGSYGEVNVTQGAQLLTATPAWRTADPDEVIRLGVNGGTGVATIDGAGSIWKVVGSTTFTGGGTMGEIGELYVGQSGAGQLTVANGGTLSIGQIQYDYGYDPVTYQSYYYETDYAGGLGTSNWPVMRAAAVPSTSVRLSARPPKALGFWTSWTSSLARATAPSSSTTPTPAAATPLIRHS